MTIVYDQQPSGQCPVQAEGTINGVSFYFRGRGKRMALYVHTAIPKVHTEIYTGVNSSKELGAGYAEPQECLDFIVRAAKILLNQEKQA